MKKQPNKEDYYISLKTKNTTLAMQNQDQMQSLHLWFPLVAIQYPYRFERPKEYICHFADGIYISLLNPKLMVNHKVSLDESGEIHLTCPAIYLKYKIT